MGWLVSGGFGYVLVGMGVWNSRGCLGGCWVHLDVWVGGVVVCVVWRL